MQSTISEHARSAEAGLACAECHMPRAAAGHRSHAFPGGYDRALVQGALQLRAEREGGRVRVTLTPRRAGHAVPTGDLFRRLEVSAEAIGAEWQVLAAKRRFLARHFRRVPSPFGVALREVVSDDRPLAAPVTVELELGDAARALPISWRVAYQRVEHPRSERDEDSVVAGEIELAHGTLEVQP